MRSASVGFQCPECVAAGSRTARTARTPLGGRLTDDASRVTLILIGVNVAVYLLGFVVHDLTGRFAMLGAFPAPPAQAFFGVAAGESYRLVTGAFLHAGIFHILFNMFALSQIGPVLEAALGRIRFLTLYLLAALGGSVTGYLLAPPAQASVGASGAIFGLFGAYYVVVRRLGGDTGPILVLLVINLVLTFTIPNIDWRAHIGGMVTGAAVAAAFAFAPRGPRQQVWQLAACVAVGLVLVVAVVLRTAALTA